MTALSVHIGGRLVGTLDASDRRSLRFTYDSGYIVDPASTPLSVSMPLRAAPFSHATVHPYLWGLLPDNEQVIERWARQFGCSASDVVGLLREVGTDVAGAAQYVAVGAVPDESSPGHVEWLDGDAIAGFLADVRRDTSAWHPHTEGRWSLAGAQGKIALLHEPDGDRWGIPRGSIPTTHILKPAPSGLDDFDLNEHLCLAAARKLGLTAARTWVTTFADQRALVVERYDRIRVDGGIQRVHQEDLCQALSVHPDRKYESDGGPGAVRLGQLVDEVAGRRDTERFYEALTYNWLLLAPDGHAKNFSLLLSGPQVRLAPLYDIASGLAYLHSRKARLGQAIGDERRPTFIASRHWERLARSLNLDADASHQRIATLIDRLPDAFADAEAESDFTDGERHRAADLRDRIAGWLATPRRAMT